MSKTASAVSLHLLAREKCKPNHLNCKNNSRFQKYMEKFRGKPKDAIF
jgi:hypothetical protein